MPLEVNCSFMYTLNYTQIGQGSLHAPNFYLFPYFWKNSKACAKMYNTTAEFKKKQLSFTRYFLLSDS